MKKRHVTRGTRATRHFSFSRALFLIGAILVALVIVFPADAIAGTSVDIPFAVTVLNPCPYGTLPVMDMVALTGNVHIQQTTTLTASGNTIMTTTTNWQGVSGIGVPSGVGYTAADNSYSSDKDINDTTTTYDTQEEELISQTGAIPNFYLRMKFKQVGTAAPTMDSMETYCTASGGTYDVTF